MSTHMLRYLGLGVLALGLQAPAWGQRNAADVYAQAGAVMSDLSASDVNELSRALMNPAGDVPASTVLLIRTHGRARLLLLRAGRISRCAFRWTGHSDPLAPQPYLGTIDRGYKLLLADAVLRLQRSDYDNAIRSIEAVYGMASHMRRDRRESSSNKAMWMILEADRLLEHAQGIGGLDAGRSARVARACRTLDMRDPTGTADMAAATTDRTLHWYEDLYEEGRLDELQGYLSIFGEDNPLRLDAMQPEEFYDTLDAGAAVLEKAVDALVQIEDKTEQNVELQRILETFQDDESCTRLFPWFENVMRWSWQLQKARQTVRVRLNRLDEIAKGELGLEQMANAAFWYVRGGKALENIPRDHWDDLVHRIDLSRGERERGEQRDAKWLRQAEEALKIFDEAATIEHCDFAVVRRDERGYAHAVHLAPDYALGVWEAFELYHARVVHHLPTEEGRAPIAELSTCLGMIRHLAGDSVMASSLCAHVGFRRTVALCEKVLAHGNVHQAHRDQLAEAYERLSPADPFGYHTSARATRTDLAAVLARRLRGRTPDQRRSEMTKAVRSWSGDQLMCGLMLFNVLSARPDGRAGEVDGAAKAAAMGDARAVAFLAGVLGAEWVDETAGRAVLMAVLLQERDAPVVDIWPVSMPGPVDALREEARRDYRRSHRVFYPSTRSSSTNATGSPAP